jgi:hypothetical protein
MKCYVGHILLEKKAFADHNLSEKLSEKINLIKLYNFVSFKMFAGHTNASGGPHAAHEPRVLDP